MTNQTTRETLQQLGARIGRAIAHDVIADDMPREWIGLSAQDVDQISAAGYDDGRYSDDYQTIETIAQQTYEALMLRLKEER